MRRASEDWFTRRTWPDPPWSAAELAVAKRGPVSVVLPALDEEATVGGVVTSVVPLLGTLVDEIVVVDSGSGDRTVEVATAAGARVVHREDVLPGVTVRPGKGEVLWRSLAATTGEHVVFLDADLTGTGPGYVTALLGPLLTEDGVELVKGFYERPDDGGRVTELTARPALAALRPELAGVIQPLGGEYAARRSLLESLPFAGGYGVEIGLLLDTHRVRGLDAIAQVDLGVREHRRRELRELGVTAAEVLDAALRRCADHRSDGVLTQFVPLDGAWKPDEHRFAVADRPPLGALRARAQFRGS